MGLRSLSNPVSSFKDPYASTGLDAHAPKPHLIAVEYLVIAAGGGGGWGNGGGGGAGGYRTNYTSSDPVSTPKISGGGGAVESGYTVALGSVIPLYIGGGGEGGSEPAGNTDSTDGGDSKFGDITSAGGGAGGTSPAGAPARNGESGG